jgi:hypothetical protein
MSRQPPRLTLLRPKLFFDREYNSACAMFRLGLDFGV